MLSIPELLSKHHSLEPMNGILGKLAEADERWEFLLESALQDLYSAWLVEKSKISCYPFPSKFRLLWIWFWGPHWLSIVCLPGTVIVFLFVLFCVLRTSWELGLVFCLAGAGRLLGSCICGQLKSREPKTWPGRNVGCNPFVVGVLLTVAHSQRNCLKSFLLLAIFGNGSGYWEASVFELFNTNRNVYCLPQLKLDKIFARISE